VIDVEGEPYGHTTAPRVGERTCHETSRRTLEIEVVEGEIERLLRA
jgi:hypothetical protein